MMALENSIYSAGEFAKLTDEGVKERVNALKMQQFKLRLSTKEEEYQGVSRKKTSVLKILPLDYATESRTLLAKLEEAVTN